MNRLLVKPAELAPKRGVEVRTCDGPGCTSRLWTLVRNTAMRKPRPVTVYRVRAGDPFDESVQA